MAPTMNALVPHDGSFVHAIECVANGARVVLPAEAIERIVEYEVSPLPLAGPWVAGLATQDAYVIVSVRLDLSDVTIGRRRAKAALLTGSSKARTRWAVEVDEVLSLVHVKAARRDPRAEVEDDSPPWLANAVTADGRDVRCVDIALMLRSLGAEA
jgi:hypothetical protein